MEPYRYLEQVSIDFDLINSRDEINAVLDEIEYMFDLLEPEFQDHASDLIAKLKQKLADAD
jgi:hypothetical protein